MEESPPTRLPDATTDGPPVAPTLVRTTAPPAASPLPTTEAGFADETRALLHRRLLLIHVLTIPFGGAVAGASLLGFEQGGLQGSWSWVASLGYTLGWVYNGVVTLWLWRNPDARLVALRRIELGMVAMLAVLLGAMKFIALATFSEASTDSRYPALAAHQVGLLSTLPFYFLVPWYGVLIPNTRRRGLIVVTLLLLSPLVATLLGAAVNPSFRPHAPYIVVMTVVGLGMSGSTAVFGASRIHTLQRQAYEARREAHDLGPYSLVKLLGRGGMGEVYLARHRLLKRPCAIKLIHPELSADPSSVARFSREVQAMTALSHPNTVRVYDYGRADDGSFYYVMEYLEGSTLDALVHHEGPLEPGRAVRLLRQVCGALAEAHGAGLIHRDLKPANVFVATLGGQPDVAKLLDFGLVKDLGAASEEGHLTQTGTVMGTPAYLSPEQAGGEPSDRRGDVYSLGAVAFFVLTGRPPFEGNSVGKLLSAHLTQQPPRADEVRSDVPAALSEVIARCLKKAPGERYQSVEELDAALAACVA